MTVIACRMCGEQKPTKAFHRNSAAPGGRRLECIVCRRALQKEYYAATASEQKARTVAWARANRDRAREASRRHNEANREKRRAQSRAWQRDNKARDAARSASQRAALQRATPAWANKAYIDLFYEIAKLEEARTGRPIHVDHIYPLASPLVCGLHVEDNLQLLFAEDNIRKKNSIPNGGGLSL